jgi:hypothetical protein
MTVPRQVKHRSAKAKARDQAGRRVVTRSCHAGAVALKHAGDPNVGEFSNEVVLKKLAMCRKI